MAKLGVIQGPTHVKWPMSLPLRTSSFILSTVLVNPEHVLPGIRVFESESCWAALCLWGVGLDSEETSSSSHVADTSHTVQKMQILENGFTTTVAEHKVAQKLS